MNQTTLMKKARGLLPCSLVFKNARVVNVFTREIMACDIAVENGIIIGLGSYQGKEEIDLDNMYVAPGFIDGHVHIESSLVTPPYFASLVMPKGTTTIIADPHEIANVKGVQGIKYMLKAAEKTPLDVYMMIPSSVPATTFETAGATIDVADINHLKTRKGVHGLGEVMNYPDVLAGKRAIHEKIATMQPRVIDGHAPGVKGLDLNAYITAGVQTDHECSTQEELIERLRRGMYVHLREGSVTRNVQDLLGAVNKNNLHRVLFCTDDKHPEDIVKEGHINANINLAIQHGIDPIDAIAMASLHAAQCYGLNHKGAIAPTYEADLVVFEDLNNIQPIKVYKKGKQVADRDHYLPDIKTYVDQAMHDSVHIETDQLSFDLKTSSKTVKVIGLIKNNITTKKLKRTIDVKDGLFQHNPKQDILKVCVIDRHQNSGRVGVGLVEGFGFKQGTLAMTIAHDSHHLIMVGDDDQDMQRAAEEIKRLGGGIVFISNQQVKHALPLEIGGIMTSSNPEAVGEVLLNIKNTLKAHGLSADIDDPIIQLAFLSLAVIPTLKLTDYGLFDVEAFNTVSIEWDDD